MQEPAKCVVEPDPVDVQNLFVIRDRAGTYRDILELETREEVRLKKADPDLLAYHLGESILHQTFQQAFARWERDQ